MAILLSLFNKLFQNATFAASVRSGKSHTLTILLIKSVPKTIDVTSMLTLIVLWSHWLQLARIIVGRKLIFL